MKIYIDGHCDTLTNCYDDNSYIDNTNYCFNITDAKKLVLDKKIPVIQTMAIFINPDSIDGNERAIQIIDYYLNNKKEAYLIKDKNDLDIVYNNKKIGVILSIENGKAIENKLENIDILYEKGIRIMSVNWNEDNLLGTGALTKKDTGLTNFGVQYVKKLEQKNILIDISHSSEKTFWDVIKNTTKTIVATHSCCYFLCNHPRNLKDDQIKAIASRNGIIGICLCSPFLCKAGRANVEDIEKHIKHVIDLIGEDYVGLGTDFDGVDKQHQLIDIRGLKDIDTLIKYLIRMNYSKNTISKIIGENWLRVIKNNI